MFFFNCCFYLKWYKEVYEKSTITAFGGSHISFHRHHVKAVKEEPSA